MADQTELVNELKRRAAEEGGPEFWGWPDRWWDAHLRRCPNDHVSSMVLSSEALGRDACLACRAQVFLTFPEDHDGPLEIRTPQGG